MHAVHVQVGLFTYALVLGIVAEDVQSLAEGLKKGNTEIVEEGHTVIFHTNPTTPNMLRQVLHLMLILIIVSHHALSNGAECCTAVSAA